MGMVGVPLNRPQIDRFYRGAANAGIWPLFHYFTCRAEFDTAHWHAYRDVNRLFADVALAHIQPTDIVFVQDYHLFLVPALLRRAMPDLRIGFFLHIPFPSSEVFRIFPWRQELLEGMLGADVIGFHTLDYVRHFQTALLTVLGYETRSGAVEVAGRVVQLAAMPLGIDAAAFEERAASAEVERELRKMAEAAAGRKVVLGIDRLDYTKGIPQRLLAIEKFLREHPQSRDQVMFIQVAVPTREGVQTYRELKREVEELVGRINGAYGSVEAAPIHYLCASLPPTRLSALYRLADVALVTPLRDGLNLIAKEYVASRVNGDGVLVLSEFAGAAWELGEALMVNPYDADAVAATLSRALSLPPEEAARRMASLRARVKGVDVHRWVGRWISALSRPRKVKHAVSLGGEEKARLVAAWQAAKHRLLLLDYDGTLRQFADVPEDAAPTPEILSTLSSLCQLPGTRVYILSGRSATVLDEWLGATGVGLSAEHGATLRLPGEKAFQEFIPGADRSWRGPIREILTLAVERVPGSRIEEKEHGLAWHYRQAEEQLAARHARQLSNHISEAFSNAPLKVLRGHKVIEVCPVGNDKGTAAAIILKAEQGADFLLAAGDDVTDEDMFRRLPPEAFTIRVGAGPTAARYWVPGPAEMLRLLGDLAKGSSAKPRKSARQAASALNPSAQS